MPCTCTLISIYEPYMLELVGKGKSQVLLTRLLPSLGAGAARATVAGKAMMVRAAFMFTASNFKNQ